MRVRCYLQFFLFLYTRSFWPRYAIGISRNVLNANERPKSIMMENGMELYRTNHSMRGGGDGNVAMWRCGVGSIQQPATCRRVYVFAVCVFVLACSLAPAQ